MKRIFAATALLSLLVSHVSVGQDSLDCGTEPLQGEQIQLDQFGGIYLTSEGILKVLVVFARFRDDTDPHPYWPVDGDPIGYATYVDPDAQTNSTHYLNLTHYYKKMSLGTFEVIGQAVSVETPLDREDYIPPGGDFPNQFDATKDVLQTAVDPLVNFADYDNWEHVDDYTHLNQSDETVDMIVMIWRGLAFSDQWSGEASMGRGGSFSVESGTMTIKTGYLDGEGSGVTVHYWGARPREYTFHSGVHEVGHWLLGSHHPYNSLPLVTDNHLIWGMLTGSNEGICANTYERERVAWINPNLITGDILNAPFQDYVEYGTAYKYHPSGGATNEHYYFENHQRLSIYDNATSNLTDKGIFVIHQQEIYASQNNIRVKTSNGQWNWENSQSASCFGGVTVPAFKMLTANRNGRNNRDELLTSGGLGSFLFAILDDDGVAVCGDWLHGGGLNNSFNLTYNNVFSPYSNPYSRTWSNVHVNFTMEVFDQNESTVNARFFLTDPVAGKPAKPTLGFDPNIEAPQYGWVYLAWGADVWDGQPIEPDVNWSELQRKIGDVGSYTTVYAGSARTWQDHSIIYDPNGPTPVYFRVRVRDTQNKYSLWSDTYNTARRIAPQKVSTDEGTEVAEYELRQNYPNPFNPTTVIKYALAADSRVTLKVYDILGREVKSLINEARAAGYHQVTLDASGLATGVYFYRLNAGSFTDVKKFVVAK